MDEPQQYRKKPVVIEAMLLEPANATRCVPPTESRSTAGGRVNEYKLEIDWCGRPHTANDERKKHWRALAPIHRTWRDAGAQAAMVHRLKGLPPCVVTVQARYKDGRVTDPDGCAPSVKCVLDGLVEAGCWPDDTGEWVRGINYLPPLVDRSKPHALLLSLAAVEAP